MILRRLTMLGLAPLCLPLLQVPAAAQIIPPDFGPERPVLDDIGGRIEEGRHLLAQKRAPEAEAHFRALYEQEGTLRTRMWVIRSWLPQGRVNDALNAIDELSQGGAEGPAIDYLYGMAFHAKAVKNLADRADLSVVGMSFEDSVGFLERATQADYRLYHDAFFPLAEAAWNTQKVDVARKAVQRALVLDRSPEVHLLLGRIALKQYELLRNAEDPAQRGQAQVHMVAAERALQAGARLVDGLERPEQQNLKARIYQVLGHAYMWQEDIESAKRSYAEAVGWDPSVVDFSVLRDLMGTFSLQTCLAEGVKIFAEHHPGETTADAGLLWWFGFANFDQKDYPGAESAFNAAVEKRPAYTNSWYFIGVARYHQQDFAGAVVALVKNWDSDPSDLVASLGANKALNLSILDYLVGWCANNGKPEQAGFLSEAQSAVDPKTRRYLTNAGLFFRDAGELMARSASTSAKANGYYERSLASYSQALALDPEDPAILNDTAVVLHYYLKRELERAKGMYQKAYLEAEKRLAQGGLTNERRALYEIAHRDSKNNLAVLERELGGGK